MAHPNEVMMRNYLKAWEDGDPETASTFWSDDITLHLLGNNPYAKTYVGKEAYNGYVKKLMEITVGAGGKALTLEIIDSLANDNHAVDILRVRYERPGKKPVETLRVAVFKLSQGKIKEETIFDKEQDAIDEFFS